jgi:Fur family ferric uptake transcriptional regulator
MRASSVEQAILDVLSHEHAHLTSLQLYEEIRQRLPAVNPSTVYRALERMVHAGKVSVSDMGTGAAVYELVSQKLHHHLVCQVCGRVITLPHEPVAQLFKTLEEQQHFHVVTNHLILFGICEACQRAGAEESSLANDQQKRPGNTA